MKTVSAIVIILLFSGCASENDLHQGVATCEISGRDNNLIYRLKVPKEWEVLHSRDGLEDTKNALCEFFIKDVGGDVRITIHNFPSKTIEDRVAPEAQIARWKRQFTGLDYESVRWSAESFAGFIGLLFEASGEMGGTKQTMIAFSMQIAKEHYRLVNDEQKKADYTIKAVGPSDLMEKKRDEIIKYARTFELIDEIGYP